MGTSLAPSPIDKVVALMPFFTRRTTRAFWSGDTRQQMTTLHFIARARKRADTSVKGPFEGTNRASDLPSMMSAYSVQGG